MWPFKAHNRLHEVHAPIARNKVLLVPEIQDHSVFNKALETLDIPNVDFRNDGYTLTVGPDGGVFTLSVIPNSMGFSGYSGAATGFSMARGISGYSGMSGYIGVAATGSTKASIIPISNVTLNGFAHTYRGEPAYISLTYFAPLTLTRDKDARYCFTPYDPFLLSAFQKIIADGTVTIESIRHVLKSDGLITTTGWV